uniref:Holin n=1 Tax=Siphoviridae sp. ctcfw7 TaxID=2826394 RepID=A0A8S5MGA1_9CAUD|nr:MAG TPA: holin [Siphoviridae sp. ctcfw7]
MFLHQFINSDFYKLLNSQLFASCIGAFVTIAGVWLTIYNDRKSRRVE